MQLTVSEIVSSVQGEGRYSGFPTTFVRLYGCNLQCEYCDTKYANKGKRKKMSIDTVLSSIFKMGNKHVCFTGGEPMLQETMYCVIYDLVDRGYIVSIETNGSIEIEDAENRRSFSYCMDIKCPSSGMSDRNIYRNLANLQSHDEVKFVILNEDDYVFAKDIIAKYPTKAQLIFSPCFMNGKYNGTELASWLVNDKIPNARLGVQLHKLVGFY